MPFAAVGSSIQEFNVTSFSLTPNRKLRAPGYTTSGTFARATGARRGHQDRPAYPRQAHSTTTQLHLHALEEVPRSGADTTDAILAAFDGFGEETGS